ncbi:hypothetical protein SLS58_004309 [Diplodia intermedia]|uniref:Uncharacterized protein n=1 Tax=Diplodia intermedia TaxID=856260 RepID=A0ABR3TU22_9PEZI
MASPTATSAAAATAATARTTRADSVLHPAQLNKQGKQKQHRQPTPAPLNRRSGSTYGSRDGGGDPDNDRDESRPRPSTSALLTKSAAAVPTDDDAKQQNRQGRE